MTITERVELKKAGIEVLRPQYDSRKNSWKIVKCTIMGGWSRFGNSWYYTREHAQEAINQIVSNYPKIYKSDD